MNTLFLHINEKIQKNFQLEAFPKLVKNFFQGIVSERVISSYDSKYTGKIVYN